MLILGTILLILSNAVNTKRDSSILYSRITIQILTYTCILAYINLNINFLSNGISLYAGLFKCNNNTLIFNLFLLIISILILSISSFHENINNVNSDINSNLITEDSFKLTYNKANLHFNIKNNNKIIEYPLIILFCIIGGIFLISSSDLISMFISIELQSYALYLICSIYRNSENSVSAGLTYFLLGGLSSCIILLGQSLLYVNTGTTNIENIYIIKNIYDVLDKENLLNIDLNIYNFNSIQYSIIILSIGLLFKISSAPFHF
jgi:NADH-ubiquinone oxidoreductase chain 2